MRAPALPWACDCFPTENLLPWPALLDCGLPTDLSVAGTKLPRVPLRASLSCEDAVAPAYEPPPVPALVLVPWPAGDVLWLAY